ncbi:MAG: NYN domain-containing protein [Lachnospiraceae bacterium]|nr:NYN domain-containing protein [Lachnospiraceae bacterium]
MKKIVTGILAHVDAGKTTLSESLLLAAGAIRKAGRVDNRDAFLDYNKWERDRGITIYAKFARVPVGDTELILADTPGHVDFSGEMERTLNICDQAILIISATDGVQSHTRTVWRLLRERNIPTFIFVNKTDLPGPGKEIVLKNLKESLSPEIVDFTNQGTEAFYEDIATGSEELLDSYMNSGKIPEDMIRTAIADSKIFPVMFGSALKQEGTRKFLETLVKFSTNPAALDGFGAVCVKIDKDKGGNRLTHLKVTGGTLKVKDIINGEKINEIRLYSGEKYESVKEVSATEICAVTGLKDTHQGEVYGFETRVPETRIDPVLIYAVEFPLGTDKQAMYRNLCELMEEEPGLRVEYNEETRDIFVHLMGEVQTEIIASEIKERFGTEVSFGTGKILYKETIKDTVEGVGHFEPLRHYAEVHLLMEPLEPGKGLRFESEVSVNDLALNWQRLVLTHLQERVHRGVLTGSPITDIKMTLVAGKAHLKHTEGGDFRQATYRAVRQGLMLAESVLLEPYYYYELRVPEGAVGRAMTDIDRMCGTAVISGVDGGITEITGKAPVSTLNGYAKEVAAYTKGLGSLSVSLAGYEKCHNAEEVIATRGYDPVSDMRNPCDSVFCSHGSGVIVPWDEVYEHMHLPLTLGVNTAEEAEDAVSFAGPTEHTDLFLTVEEVDEIIDRTARSNVKGDKHGKPRVDSKPVVYRGTKLKDKYLLIDGYNLVHAWPELSELSERDISAAAGKLMDYVSDYCGITGLNTILVFDAYKLKNHPTEELNYHNIKVVYTKTAETADRYIERYAHENGRKYEIIVVTSDGAEQIIIRGGGCVLQSCSEFIKDYERRKGNLSDMKLPEGVKIL